MNALIRARRSTVRFALAGSAALAVLTLAASASGASFIAPDSLLISTTSYVDTGVAATPVAGVSNLAGSKAGTTVKAVSSG